MATEETIPSFSNEPKEIEYKKVLNNSIDFNTALKVLPTTGNLVYEYNPFRNYRLSQTSYLYKSRLYSPKELLKELGKTEIELPNEEGSITLKLEEATNEQCLQYIDQQSSSTEGTISWKNLGVPETEQDPILYEPGELTDFETNELSFDLNHPVDILPQYSYDNSVNLIINDGKNKPRLINSRFSATTRNKYQIVDRKGNNDTNIYDQGSQFDIDTSLYKQVIEIPKLRLVGVSNGGKLPVGNYHFYFRYADADGNETDFVAESGLVSIFIGNSPSSIRSGFRDEDSHKLVRLMLSNIDSAYQYVYVYYTRSTSDIYENASVSTFRIEQKFLVNNLLNCEITITGYEDITEVTTSDINPMYQLADSIETQATCQNRLFIGNIQRPEIPYQELTDLSLRFLPHIQEENYPLEIDSNYNISSSSFGYYDPKFIYNKVGYWNHELYRIGIVYIMSNNSLSPVFNVRGIENLNPKTQYSKIPMWVENDGTKQRNYIIHEEDTYKIVTDSSSYKLPTSSETTPLDNTPISGTNSNFENSMGVIWLNMPPKNAQQIYSINFEVPYEVVTYLRDTLNIKGFFFVRQKRIPTILCQAYTIGVDKESNTPVLPVWDKTDSKGIEYVSERFLTNDQLLDNSFDNRLYQFKFPERVRTEAAICPEYDVNSPYLNSLFSGDDFVITESDIQPTEQYLKRNDRNFYTEGSKEGNPQNTYNVKIIGVEDDTKLVAINDTLFSARAGEAEEAFRYEYLENENISTKSTNLLRGSFGPYIGITGYNYSGKIIDIKIPGFNSVSESDLFKIRYSDKSPFYAISDRVDLKHIDEWFNLPDASNNSDSTVSLLSNLYRGDCYICQFTHRLNRNFQDPTAPTNDKIVDPNCWKDNYEVEDGVVKTEKFESINLGDVNAIKLGMWVTIQVRSTRNLNIRAIDESMVDEAALTGHPRGFFPYFPISGEGSYKIPEALCCNKGFEKSLSERYNFESPDVPAIKNDFTNRISYSDIQINDAFKNGFRVFQGTNYRDYPKTYGSITKIIELRGNLLCVFEHGVALIPVNERTISGEGTGGNVYINTSNVLPENPKVLSDTFGSQWKESIIKTPRAVYGVDTVGKKIWRTNGETFECISDFKVQEFLNQNISLTERELQPIIGIRNVKTHFNKFKNDVMFTFYDNLYGFEEKVWNLCYNENLQKWITFYSWVPSYSENIYNQYFSFDRNTSKWIAKLGVSKQGSDFADGIVLKNNIIEGNGFETTLDLVNRTLPEGDGITYKIEYELVQDNYNNKSLFTLKGNTLKFVGDYSDITSEFYEREGDLIKKDDRGRRMWLPYESQVNRERLVILLNIQAHIKVQYDSKNGEVSLKEAYASGYTDRSFIDAGYYQSTVALISKYNMQFLTTDFWKHGQAGIIDIADKIYPTYWYGKQHPFEFEFIVADSPDKHKIFDNLEIISNSAEPESFHYEVIGDCYDFAKDKKNMYIRQEATKAFFQSNGSDITYDPDYSKLDSVHRPIINDDGKEIKGKYDRSTILPLYYYRKDTINEIEDQYNLKEDVNTKDFSALAGGEIVHYKTLDEYRIWNHAKAVNMQTKGRLRGNMQYNEDRWLVQVNPINVIYNNEPEWKDLNGNTTDKIPIELNQSLVPNDIKNATGDPSVLINEKRGYTKWGYSTKMSEVKPKDKWIKIRIRYNGERLAVITAIKTLYSISYS